MVDGAVIWGEIDVTAGPLWSGAKQLRELQQAPEARKEWNGKNFVWLRDRRTKQLLVAFRVWDEGEARFEPRVFIPGASVTGFILHFHTDTIDGGHRNFEETLRRIQQHGWFPHAYSKTKKLVKACISCAKGKHVAGLLAPMRRDSIGTRPFEFLQIDFVGPIRPAAMWKGRKCTAVFTCICMLTGWVWLMPVPDETAETAAMSLLEILFDMGPPRVIRSDRGVHFVHLIIQRLAQLVGATWKLGSPFTPTAQAAIESSHVPMNNFLRTKLLDGRLAKDWPLLVLAAQWCFRIAGNRARGGGSAFELVLGFKPGSLLSGLRPTGNDFWDRYWGTRFDMMKSNMADVIAGYAERQEGLIWANAMGKTLAPGTWVMVKRADFAGKRAGAELDEKISRRLQATAQGPFKVLQDLGSALVLEGRGRENRRNCFVFHPCS